MVFDYLEEFRRLRDSSGLQLGPNWNIIKVNFEGSRRNELSLNCVGEEEDHEATVNSVVHQPAPKGRAWLTYCLENVDPRSYADHHQKLKNS